MTRDGPGGCDQMLAVKRRKTAKNLLFFRKKIKITQKKYRGNKFSASGVSPKWVKSKRRRKKDSGGTSKAAWANFISRLVDLKQLWQIVMV